MISYFNRKLSPYEEFYAHLIINQFQATCYRYISFLIASLYNTVKSYIILYISTISTHSGWVTHICVSKSGDYSFRKWLVASSVPRHYLNQCWVIVSTDQRLSVFSGQLWNQCLASRLDTNGLVKQQHFTEITTKLVKCMIQKTRTENFHNRITLSCWRKRSVSRTPVALWCA